MFKIKTKREFDVTVKAGKTNVTLTFRKGLKEEGMPFIPETLDVEKLTAVEERSLFYTELRYALVDWKGIGDEDGVVLPVVDADGSIITNNQILVFDAVMDLPGFSDKLIKAWNGFSSKN